MPAAGQHIDMSLLDTTLATLSHRLETYLVSGKSQAYATATAAADPPDFECADGPGDGAGLIRSSLRTVVRITRTSGSGKGPVSRADRFRPRGA